MQKSVNADVEILQNCFSVETNAKLEQFSKKDFPLIPQENVSGLYDHITGRSKLPSPNNLFSSPTLFKSFEKPQYKQHQQAFVTALRKDYKNLELINKAQDACYFIAYVSIN